MRVVMWAGGALVAVWLVWLLWPRAARAATAPTTAPATVTTGDPSGGRGVMGSHVVSAFTPGVSLASTATVQPSLPVEIAISPTFTATATPAAPVAQLMVPAFQPWRPPVSPFVVRQLPTVSAPTLPQFTPLRAGGF